MAQSLKPELKSSILTHAAEEFLTYGYDNSSMRRIAKSSGMTVGNLYRYFTGKEDLIHQIVSSTFDHIQTLLREKSLDMVSMFDTDFAANVTLEHAREILSELADELVDIYNSSRVSFNVLMLHSRFNSEITKWFSDFLYAFLSSKYHDKITDGEIIVLAHSYAESLFTGMRSIFSFSELKESSLKKTVRIYFDSFINMLDLFKE